jgi:uncharacterized membrane protein
VLSKALSSSLFTRLGVLAVLVLSLAAVSFSRTPSATACGHCWWSIGAEAFTCSPDNQTRCTLSSNPAALCTSGGACNQGGGGGGGFDYAMIQE